MLWWELFLLLLLGVVQVRNLPSTDIRITHGEVFLSLDHSRPIASGAARLDGVRGYCSKLGFRVIIYAIQLSISDSDLY